MDGRRKSRLASLRDEGGGRERSVSWSAKILRGVQPASPENVVQVAADGTRSRGNSLAMRARGASTASPGRPSATSSGDDKQALLGRPRGASLGASKRSFWKPIITAWAALLFTESSRGLMMPSIFVYVEELGGNSSSYGIIVGGFSIGRLIASFLLGAIHNRHGAKWAIVIALSASFIGNFVYAIDESLIHSVYALMAARALTGFGSGVLTVTLAVVSEETTVKQRVKFMAITTLIQFVGFAIMPILAHPLALFSFRLGPLMFDNVTTPGYLLTVLNFCGIVLALILMHGYKSRVKLAAPAPEDASKPKVPPTAAERRKTRLMWSGVALFILLNLVVRGVLSFFETLGPPIFAGLLGLTEATAVQQCSNMLAYLGIGGVAVFLLVDPLTKVIPDNWLLLLSIVFIGGGLCGLINYHNFGGPSLSVTQFYIAGALLWSIGSPIGQTLVVSSFSKIVGSKPQGIMMSFVAAGASVGRASFPMISGFVSHDVSFMIGAAACVVAIVCLVVYQCVVRVMFATQKQVLSSAAGTPLMPQTVGGPAAVPDGRFARISMSADMMPAVEIDFDAEIDDEFDESIEEERVEIALDQVAIDEYEGLGRKASKPNSPVRGVSW